MTLEEAIFVRLSAFSALTSIVADRIYPVRAPQDALTPRITFQRISGFTDHVLRGPSGLIETRLQVDAWVDEGDGTDAYAISRAAALEVIAALDGFRGDVQNPASSGDFLRIKSSRLENSQDLDEEERHLRRISLDFVISHDEES